MEELKTRYEQLLKAYKRLDYMVHKYRELSLLEISKQSTPEEQENELIVHRDALIKRFEFCYDLTWKFFKLFLRKQYALDIGSPKAVFRECHAQGLLALEETQMLLDIVDARNETSHVYDEERANAISIAILSYYEFLSGVVKRINVGEKLSIL